MVITFQNKRIVAGKPAQKACADSDETQPELVTMLPTPNTTSPRKKVQSFEDSDTRRADYQNVPPVNFELRKQKKNDAATNKDSDSASLPTEPPSEEPAPKVFSDQDGAENADDGDKEVLGQVVICVHLTLD